MICPADNRIISDLQRFFAKVDILPESGCWQWQGYRDQKGYGQFKFNGRVVWCHRFIYEVLVKFLEDGQQVHHKCTNTGCVNPAHLEAVTMEENLKEENSRQRVKRFLQSGRSLFPLEEILEEVPQVPLDGIPI